MEIYSKSAEFSQCRIYCYNLWRKWDENNHKYVMFIGLNPSTADEIQDDPTIRRCIQYSKDWGYGALCMTNLFAFRATQPKDMMAAIDPIGPMNDAHLLNLSKNAGIVVAAWGKEDGKFNERDKQVLGLVQNLHCLKLNKDGSPAHPLYLKKDLKPFLMN